MKVKVITSAVLLALMVSQPATAVDAPQSPLMKQLNNGNWLPQEEAQSLSDELYYQDAIQAYIQTLPLLNTIGLRDGSEAAFGKGYNVLPIWKERMDSRAVVPTPNGDVIYSMSYLDLKETGPLVIKAPPNVIGMFTDFFQKTITDVGAIGPDRARGGLYLLLPPDYDGPVPQGYYAFKSSTYNVFLFFRTIMGKGDGKPDPVPAVKSAETTRVYPLWDVEKEVKPMQFPDASGKRVNMMYPTDASYWQKLKTFVDYETVDGNPGRNTQRVTEHWDGERQTVQPNGEAARDAEKSRRDRATHDPCASPGGPGRSTPIVLQGPPVGKLMGGSNSGVDAVRHA